MGMFPPQGRNGRLIGRQKGKKYGPYDQHVGRQAAKKEHGA